MAIGTALKRFSAAALSLMFAGAPALAAEYYEIDPEHTFATFEYNHWGLSHQRARFDRNTGFISIDHDTKTADIYIEISAASVSTGVEIFNKVLRSDDFFDVENYPKISFKSSRLQFNEGQLVEVEGDLTIKETTRPIILQITHYNCRFMIIYGKRACGADGVATLSRTDFGMGRYRPFIGDRVTLYIAVEAIQKD